MIQSTHGRRRLAALTLGLLALVATSHAPGQAAISDVANKALQQMSKSLSSAKSFKFSAISYFDDPEVVGVSVKRYTRHQLVVSHPNRLAFEVIVDDGTRRLGWFDGKTLIIATPAEQTYSELAFDGSIDGLIAYVEDKFNIHLPVADLLYSDIYDAQKSYLIAAEYLGERQEDGRALSHFAYQSVAADWQIWFEEGARPVPRRLVITYVRVPGDPEQMIEFSGWEFDTAKDKDFTAAVAQSWTKVAIPQTK